MTITIERTEDASLIRRAALASWEDMRDDFAPAPEDYQPPNGYWLSARDSNEELGVALFVPHNYARWEAHLAMVCRGKAALAAVRLMFAHVFSDTPCRRIIAAIPAHNRKAILFARWLGMEQTGLDRRSFLYNATLHDLVLFGISKP